MQENRKGFRIAELSRRTGIPVPTIKFYLREGLLPPGERTSPNQARYGDRHVHRLRLIRVLIELATLPVARVGAVLAALDADDRSLHDRIGAVHRAVSPDRRLSATDEARAAAATEVRDLLDRRGWSVRPDAPAVATLVETIAAVRSLGHDRLADRADGYAEAVERLAELEVAGVASRPDADQIAENVVVGTVLGEMMISALRLLAHESASARTLVGPAAARVESSD
jgi:DNA-binding transcriptional MerR regulator